jgi:bacteriophage N4 adsorption protein B
VWRRFTIYRRFERACVDSLAAPAKPGRLAVFIPAWDEGRVIGQMLTRAIETFEHDDYLLYVGCYPNDPATIAAVAAIGDPRVRLVMGRRRDPPPRRTASTGCGKP